MPVIYIIKLHAEFVDIKLILKSKLYMTAVMRKSPYLVTSQCSENDVKVAAL